MRPSARQWNVMLRNRRRNRIIGFNFNASLAWLHPWTIACRYDDDLQQWTLSIKAGYVNGLPATVNLPASQAPDITLARLKRAGTPAPPNSNVDSFLTEYPAWPLSTMRSLGPDADPTGSSTDANGNTSLSFESVPAFFVALGVGPPPQSTSPTDGSAPLVTEVTDPRAVRLLRATDIVLFHDLPTAIVDTTVDQTSVTSTVALGPSQVSPFSYLRQFAKYTPPSTNSDDISSLANLSPATNVAQLLGTLYFVSSAGAVPGSAPDASWQPYPDYSLFWNCNFGYNLPTLKNPVDNSLTNPDIGLAGGIGQAVEQGLINENNNAQNVALLSLGPNGYQGLFHSV